MTDCCMHALQNKHTTETGTGLAFTEDNDIHSERHVSLMDRGQRHLTLTQHVTSPVFM